MAVGAEQQLNDIPRHVAIIMDGNGRWAKARGLNRLDGHKQGVKSVLTSIETAASLGVKYLTLYTFSTENWNRPQEEVNGLMSLFIASIQYYTDDMMKKGVRLKFIGERRNLSSDVQAAMQGIEEKTAGNDVITVMPALNYGGRQEILHAVQEISQQVLDSSLEPEDISLETISNNLYTEGIPDPDFLIRTSGEMRLSNFLLWQLSYAEFYVTDIHWPDFSAADFNEAMESYRQRGRRFGGTVNVKV